MHIDTEGAVKRFVDDVVETTFNAASALERGQEILYITERAVFRLDPDGPTLIEVAAGIDPHADVIAHMEFTPLVADELKTMDPAVFADGVMGLSERLAKEGRW